MSGPPHPTLRDYGIGAQILIDLGVHEMVLLSNTDHTIIGLDGYGLRVAGNKPAHRGAGPMNMEGGPKILIVEARYYAHIADELAARRGDRASRRHL